MDYVRIGETDRIELVAQDDDHVYGTQTPSGVYRTLHQRPGDRAFSTELFIVPNIPESTLTVIALGGLFHRPDWQTTIPVRVADRPALLVYLGEEETLSVRDVDGTDSTLTLRHILRMQYAMGLMLAKSGHYRANMSDRIHMMHGIYDWLQAAWDRYQLGTGLARSFRRVSTGRYDDPYMNTCKPLPDGWTTELLSHRYKIIHMLDEYEMRTSLRPRPDNFWPEWHAGWDNDIIPTLQTMAAPYGWTRIHNPREVAAER